MRLPFFLALVLTLVSPPALADQVRHKGQLICEGNRALIRFATTLNAIFPPDPSAIPFTAAPANADTCTLADGREVRIKTGGRMPTAWGMCGGASNTFISLWIDQRKVLSRHWVQHACYAERDYADIIVLDGDTLTLCASADSIAT